MKRAAASFVFLALIFAVLCAPLLLSPRTTNYSADESEWHLPAVRQIHSHWPRLDFNRDSFSAISPAYHYVLATFSFVTGPERIPLRAITWLFSLGVFWLLWRLFAEPALALAVILPLAFSNFFVKSASYIVTDNPALLFTTGVLTLTFFAQGERRVWGVGAAAGAATFFRQLHFWTVVPLALTAWREFRAAAPRRPWALFLTLLIPSALLGLLVWQWGGLMPVQWRGVGQTTLSIAPFTYLLAAFFLVGIFYYAAWFAREWRADWLDRGTLAGAGVGLLIAVANPSVYDKAAGHWGGYLWNATNYLPAWGGRSLLFLVLAPAGAALLTIMTRRLARGASGFQAFVWAASYGAWACTFLPNRQIFHRYFEPMTLVFLIVWAALLIPKAPVRRGALHLLAALQLAMTLALAHYQTYFGQVFATP